MNNQLKKELKEFEKMYTSGPMVDVLKKARLTIIDLEDEIEDLKNQLVLNSKNGDIHAPISSAGGTGNE